MRKVRVFDKKTNQFIKTEMPYECIGTDGKFYRYSREKHVYEDHTKQVIINESLGVVDEKMKEVYTDDIVEVDVTVPHISEGNLVVCRGVMAYSSFTMSYQVIFLNPPQFIEGQNVQFTVKRVLGNVHQNKELII
jgi:hypothetical protein